MNYLSKIVLIASAYAIAVLMLTSCNGQAVKSKESIYVSEFGSSPRKMHADLTKYGVFQYFGRNNIDYQLTLVEEVDDGYNVNYRAYTDVTHTKWYEYEMYVYDEEVETGKHFRIVMDSIFVTRESHEAYQNKFKK